MVIVCTISVSYLRHVAQISKIEYCSYSVMRIKICTSIVKSVSRVNVKCALTLLSLSVMKHMGECYYFLLAICSCARSTCSDCVLFVMMCKLHT